MYGWQLTQGPFLAGSNTRLWHDMGPFGDLLSTSWWWVLWVGAGVTGMAAAARGCHDRHQKRASINRDAVGFNAVLIPPLLWVLLHLWSWVIAALNIDEGNPRGFSSAIVWGSTVAAVMIVAGWADSD